MNPAIPSAAAISTRTVRSALRRIDSSFTASPAATTSNRSATHGAALFAVALIESLASTMALPPSFEGGVYPAVERPS